MTRPALGSAGLVRRASSFIIRGRPLLPFSLTARRGLSWYRVKPLGSELSALASRERAGWLPVPAAGTVRTHLRAWRSVSVTPKEVLALIREKEVKAVDLRFMDF